MIIPYRILFILLILCLSFLNGITQGLTVYKSSELFIRKDGKVSREQTQTPVKIIFDMPDSVIVVQTRHKSARSFMQNNMRFKFTRISDQDNGDIVFNTTHHFYFTVQPRLKSIVVGQDSKDIRKHALWFKEVEGF